MADVPEPRGEGRRIGADEIAEALAAVRGTLVPRPTPQQRAVIEAPLAPALVVAGAGSGKTETMANRVLWLLANGLVAPANVLGLTFTRKAAGELGSRIRERIAELSRAGLLPDHDVFEQPVIATYNAFANSLYRDHAILVSREADAPVLGEAAAWQLARSVLVRSSHDRLPDLGRSLDALTKAVLAISRGLADDAGDPEEVRDWGRRMTRLRDLPPGSNRFEYAAAIELADSLGSLDVLVDLALEFDAEKARRGVVEYSDQIALALQIAEQHPEVGLGVREQFRIVLLDEYQDTSVVQTRLLAQLFAGHPVMAVGDPNQSIYGWRGASAAGLSQFAERFGVRERFELSTSWRNGREILRAANRVVAPFAERPGVPVDRLSPSPAASEQPIETVFVETVAEEAAAVADWFAARLRGPGDPPSAAMLMRTRRAQQYFLEALRDRGIPFHVLGIGGLLAEPEIADLVCVLRVLDDPSAGIELVRVLAGSRWRVGARDIHALSRVASWLRDSDTAGRPLADDVRERLRTSVASGEGGSLVDALDFVGGAPEGHGMLEGFSPVGLERLRDAGRWLARLRRRGSLDVSDLVAAVVQELQLDIEVAANDRRVLGSANLDALTDALDGYLAMSDQASLGGFLAWLREAEQREDLSPRPEPAEPGTVQVLTVHGAKGLEWDVVAIPRMVADEFPARPLEGYQGWLGFGRYPWPLRGDASELPPFDGEAARTRKELLDAQKAFSLDVREHVLDEERRLAYVALTRSRHRLLVSGAFWGVQRAPREPGVFLRELADAGLIAELPAGPRGDVNPLGDDVDRFVWPLDPLGDRRAAVEWAAEAVRSTAPRLAGPWRGDLELLLAEHDARNAGAKEAPLPIRIPASRFHDFVNEPERVAAEIRRPMPERPFGATRLGTLFHTWVEEHYGVRSGADVLDAGAHELDEPADFVDEERLGVLRAIFSESEWATRRPLEVEREIHLPFDDRIVVCKIDAVYETDGRFEVVDWKTGRVPTDASELERKQLQLALYRIAFARWAGIDPELVDAAFYFVAEDRVIRPERIDSEDQLLERWRAAKAPVARAG